MRAKVYKWGKSLAIRLPNAAATRWNLAEGQTVELKIEPGVITARPRNPRYSIEELVAQMRVGEEPESFDW